MGGHVPITTRQDEARSRNDNGNETAATWKAASNTGWTLAFTVSDTFLHFRHRFVIQEVGGGGFRNFEEVIQYSLNAGAWTTVGTGSPAVVTFNLSSFYADGDDTTQQVGGGTFISTNSGMTENLASGASSVPDFAGNDEFECEFMLRILKVNVSDGDTIRLRVVEGAGSLTALTEYNSASLFNIDITVEDATRRIFHCN